MKRARLMCVGEDARVRASYERLLGKSGYDVIAAGGGNQALRLLKSPEAQIDAVICDYDMHGMNGAELAAKLKHLDPKVAVIMISNCQPALEEATHFVDAALSKGAPAELVLSEVEELLGRPSQDRHLRFGYAPVGSILAGIAALGVLLRFLLEV